MGNIKDVLEECGVMDQAHIKKIHWSDVQDFYDEQDNNNGYIYGMEWEDEVEVDAEGDDIKIERQAVKAKVNVGLSPEEEIVQDSLKAAMDAAESLGNDVLVDQIGNTITYFTRKIVVGDRSD